MKGGKSTSRKSELELELKKVIVRNSVDYFWYFIWNTLCFFSFLALDCHHLMEHRIASLGGFATSLLYVGFGITFFLNIVILSEINHGELERVLKCFRWEIVAAVLMLQPRAYGVMKELLKEVEAEEEEEDSVV